MNYKMMRWTDENIKKFWDYESNFKERYFTYQVGDKVVEHFKDNLKNKKSVLDYGCGAGFLIKHLLKENIDVYGLDFSEESVRKVNEKYQDNSHFKGAYTPIEFNSINRKFDIVFIIEVIEHLDDEKLSQALGYIKTILAEGGKAIFTTPNDEDLSKSMIYCPEANCVFHRWQHVRSWSEQTLGAYLLKYFDSAEVATIKFKRQETIKSRTSKYIRKILGRYTENKQPNLIAIAGMKEV